MPHDSTLSIAVLLPDLLGTYGDIGNARVLAQRARWRGIPATVVQVTSDQPIPSGCDIYLLGGAEDTAQERATRLLDTNAFGAVIDAAAPVLAVCAGMQILGNSTTDARGTVHPGLGVLDLVTVPGRRRAIGHITTRADPAWRLADTKLLGFENHRGRTHRAPSLPPLGTVATGTGNGDGTDGAAAGNVIGTYLHGPVLALNPALADHILEQAVGQPLAPLAEPIEELARLRSSVRSRRRPRR